MNEKLFIVADLGLLRAYREVQGPHDREPRMELIEEVVPESAHKRLSEQVTDQAGRFPRGSGADIVTGDLSAGERLNLETEQNRRLIERLAEVINTLLANHDVAQCSLAASAPIHNQLLDALDPKLREKISQVLASNLARTEPRELVRHFTKVPS
jgi:hypothetical protein